MELWSPYIGTFPLRCSQDPIHSCPQIANGICSQTKEGWGPKIPDDVPNEIKLLLKNCFRYNIEDRASAGALLELIQQFVSFANDIQNI